MCFLHLSRSDCWRKPFYASQSDRLSLQLYLCQSAALAQTQLFLLTLFLLRRCLIYFCALAALRRPAHVCANNEISRECNESAGLPRWASICLICYFMGKTTQHNRLPYKVNSLHHRPYFKGHFSFLRTFS